MEEELDSARHGQAAAARWPKSPMACRLQRGPVEGGSHASCERHAFDVSLGIDLDVNGDVATLAAGSTLARIRRLLLLENLWRLDLRSGGGGCILGTGGGLCILGTGGDRHRDQGAKRDGETRSEARCWKTPTKKWSWG